MTIKISLGDSITPQARPTDVLITEIYKIHLRKTFEMVDTRSNIQLADLYSKYHGRGWGGGGGGYWGVLYQGFVIRFYPPPES